MTFYFEKMDNLAFIITLQSHSCSQSIIHMRTCAHKETYKYKA